MVRAERSGLMPEVGDQRVYQAMGEALGGSVQSHGAPAGLPQERAGRMGVGWKWALLLCGIVLLAVGAGAYAGSSSRSGGSSSRSDGPSSRSDGAVEVGADAGMVTGSTVEVPVTSEPVVSSTALSVPTGGIADQWIAIRASMPNERDVRAKASEMEAGLSVMSTEGQPALRGPNWLAYAGPFDTADAAVGYCRAEGITDFNECTVVFLEPNLTSSDGKPPFCSSQRVIIQSDGSWRRWDPSTNPDCR